jgi:hypothetical protein
LDAARPRALDCIPPIRQRRGRPRRRPKKLHADKAYDFRRCRRLTIRYERRVDIHLAFLTLACAVLCFRSLQRFC